jgi:hypothetical protein
MSLFYPDNDKREARIKQLVGDVHEYLDDARTAFQQFESLSAAATAKIQAIYSKAGLAPPTVTTLEIASVSDTLNKTQSVSKGVDMAELLINVGAAGAPLIFAPAATVELADAGLVTAEAAGAALGTSLGAEITAGGMFGGIVGILVAGVVAGGLSIILSATSGASNANELRGGIAKAKILRENACLSALRSAAMVDIVKAVAASCDSILAGLQGAQQAQVIEAMIRKDIQPAVDTLKAIDHKKAIMALYKRDVARQSWMQEG